MDYLDPQKRLQQKVLMIVGYVLIAVAVLGGTIVLLLLAYGFGLSKNGQVIQKGLVFVSSQPNSANIYLNGKKNGTTNTKLVLPAGRYTLQLQRTGYRNWQRSVTVEGGDVQHFDYPMLFPTKLATAKVHTYNAQPAFATQSPDRHWLVVAQPNASGVFDQYDLTATSPEKSVQVLTLPDGVYTKSTNDQGWQVVDWADDNRHVLLKHAFDNKWEFIELDRQDPTQSINLETSLSVNPTDISLNNLKYDQFYLYNAGDHTLQTDSLSAPAPTATLDHVLAYKSYSNNTLLYATNGNAAAGKVDIKMQVGTKTYALRTVAASPAYLLDMASYSGKLYVLAGGSAENRVYLYPDPTSQVDAHPERLPLPMRAMRITSPSYLSFSTTAQFIMVENGSSIVLYDLENSKSYTYTLAAPLDAPQQHVTWMDGDRLVYVSKGKLVVVDYDNTNAQSLMNMLPDSLPFFSPNFRNVYTLAPGSSQPAIDLTVTPLVTS